jgi:hypothetical protein
VDQLHGRTAQEIVADLNCLRMVAPAIEKCHHLTEYVGGGGRRGERGNDPLPVMDSRLMMLIIGNFEGKEIARDREHWIHWS